MAAAQQAEYDLLICVDATASMSSTILSLNKSLPHVIYLSALTGAFQRIGIVSYFDYCDHEVIKWSGWSEENDFKSAVKELGGFASRLNAMGGGDYPEAAKTALFHILENVSRKTIVLWYTDAPPHHKSNKSHGGNYDEEKAFLSEKVKKAQDEGKKVAKKVTPFDWVWLSQAAAHKGCTVFSILTSYHASNAQFFTLLSQVTGGVCIAMKNHAAQARHISQATMDILLAWLGRARDLNDTTGNNDIMLLRYQDLKEFDEMKDEEVDDKGYLSGNKKIDRADVKDYNFVPRRAGEALNLPVQFRANEKFRNDAYMVMGQIIQEDVCVISLNPVFGDLWRAVCSDKMNENRNAIVNEFAVAVGKLHGEEKTMMNDWLEESYNYAEVVQKMIDECPEKFPAIFLDSSFTKLDFTRKEILEISRSCKADVLRRLSEVLTHLVYVEKADEVPAHLAENDFLPISLGNDLFRVLLHLVLPGSMFAVRPAALLAALCRKIQIPFLQEPAEKVLNEAKGNWLNLDNPETFTMEAIKLLLSSGILTDEEHGTMKKMYRFKMIERNLRTDLAVDVPWTPAKSIGPAGHTDTCNKCLLERPINLMSERGICGFCLSPYEGAEKEKNEGAKRGTDKEQDKLYWYECGDKGCHAQYPVINVHLLNVKPKCHYCRHKVACPTLQCGTCKNKVVIPKKYHKQVTVNGKYTCVFCVEEPAKAIVSETTNALELAKENGYTWLGIPPKLDLAFTGRSLFAYPLHTPTPTLLTSLNTWLSTGRSQLGTCSLCFTDAPKLTLLPACSRKGCSQLVDNSCLQSWYGSNSPGKIINIAALNCPFCRRIPAGNVLRRYGLARLASVGGLAIAVRDNSAWYHGWCIDCSMAKRILERACGADPPEIDVDTAPFRCEECTMAMNLAQLAIEEEYVGDLARAEGREAYARVAWKAKQPATYKECPGCSVMTEKTEGCNHIECDCGSHWCWECRFMPEGKVQGEEAAQQVYRHMSRVHGGYYGGDED